jgi:hypothetical protein
MDQALSHNVFPDRRAVWKAFCFLVRNVLLANVGVVHNDIRCVSDSRSKYDVYNILGKRGLGRVVELKLIDYESLVVFATSSPRIPYQSHAASVESFGRSRLAYEFLFWQLLLMAYVL